MRKGDVQIAFALDIRGLSQAERSKLEKIARRRVRKRIELGRRRKEKSCSRSDFLWTGLTGGSESSWVIDNNVFESEIVDSATGRLPGAHRLVYTANKFGVSLPASLQASSTIESLPKSLLLKTAAKV